MTTLTRPLSWIALAYWFVFWMMNGLDKVLHGVQVKLGGVHIFTWFGKDRNEQFGKYFDRMELPPEAITSLLSFCGLCEFAVAALFAGALLSVRHFEFWLSSAFAATGIMFIGFSMWDVVAGDRAELLEHGTYLGVAFVTAAFIAMTRGPIGQAHSEALTPGSA